MEQTDSQLVEAVGDFQVVKIVVIKSGLADSGDQKYLHQQLAVKNKGFLTKDDHRRQQHRNKNKDALAGDEENVAQGIIFFENLKHNSKDRRICLIIFYKSEIRKSKYETNSKSECQNVQNSTYFFVFGSSLTNFLTLLANSSVRSSRLYCLEFRFFVIRICFEFRF